jgi:hypothetical protein
MSSLILPAEKPEDEEATPDISCAKCGFYVMNNVLSPRAGGTCRRYPGVPYPVGADKMGRPVAIAFWPGVRPNEWCGEFKASKAERDKAS